MANAGREGSTVEEVVEHLKKHPEARVLMVGTRQRLLMMRRELLVHLQEGFALHRTLFQELLLTNGATVRYTSDTNPDAVRGLRVTAVWVDHSVSWEMFSACKATAQANGAKFGVRVTETAGIWEDFASKPRPSDFTFEWRIQEREPPLLRGTPTQKEAPMSMPTPYSPPAELLERASLELSRATKRELSTAALAYEAYNHAVGGRSAATGAPLPGWEDNPNALVKAGWLASSQAVEGALMKELNSEAAAGLVAHKQKLLKVLRDERLKRIFAPEYLALRERMVGASESGDMEGLFEILLKHAESAEKGWEKTRGKLEALKTVVGAIFNTLHASPEQVGPLQARLLGACVVFLQSQGQEELALFLTQCAEGKVEVDGEWAEKLHAGPHPSLEKEPGNATFIPLNAGGVSPPGIPVPIAVEVAPQPTLVAMFRCDSVAAAARRPGEHDSETVQLFPLHGEENAPWSQYTPSGSLSMTITNPSAMGQVRPGHAYRLTLSQDVETFAIDGRNR